MRRAELGVDRPDAPARDLELPDIETPLRPALRATLAGSSNVHAEQLMRVLGAERRGDGSLRGGAAAVREVLAEWLGEVPAGLDIADGSGLSRGNRVSAAFVARLLRTGWQAPWADALRDAMARPGESDGTLRRRFRDAPGLHDRLWAKTGTIRGVSALSGVVLSADGGRGVAFAILMNWDRGSSSRARSLQEQLVRAIAPD
jgi:D-alanyl-D-alanine carboxypeptidase/D-alanyl-D-alanine-endopeptidase (penicillin-binding protein 4)